MGTVIFWAFTDFYSVNIQAEISIVKKLPNRRKKVYTSCSLVLNHEHTSSAIRWLHISSISHWLATETFRSKFDCNSANVLSCRMTKIQSTINMTAISNCNPWKENACTLHSNGTDTGNKVEHKHTTSGLRQCSSWERKKKNSKHLFIHLYCFLLCGSAPVQNYKYNLYISSFSS